MANTRRVVLGVAVAAGAGVAASALPGGAAAQGWEPTKTVEFIVPAGTGGGADQMARMIQGIIQKHNLMEQPIVVINKSGGAGAEGFLDVKDAGATRTRSSSRSRTCSPRRSRPACRSAGRT